QYGRGRNRCSLDAMFGPPYPGSADTRGRHGSMRETFFKPPSALAPPPFSTNPFVVTHEWCVQIDLTNGTKLTELLVKLRLVQAEHAAVVGAILRLGHQCGQYHSERQS